MPAADKPLPLVAPVGSAQASAGASDAPTDRLNVLFLNDAPVIRFGLASGFEALGHRVDYLIFGAPRARRPSVHLWEGLPDAQLRAVDPWLDHHSRPDLVLYEGFTGTDPIHPAAICRLCTRASAPFYYWAIED